jgi:phosphoribosylamine-glycine ligase
MRHTRELVDYTTRALDAFGFRFGPAYSEIMLTADGPRLVEVNSRVAGSGMAAAAQLARRRQRCPAHDPLSARGA